uniref:histidine--tRNA ligase n=1 Tax=Schimmelmannia schousboei TaxID=173468 RepID=A0A1C9C8W2_9FLOR|nr:histidine-tRNA synthetase [Schimmelmannia schousboei]AOM64826.1 histidine-tRNA synthetase [Schimmelmannia schousboei]
MQALRGTKDILPDEIIFWQYLYNKATEVLSLSNYSEIRTPILESTSLFQRSIGDGTDIVNKEMYSFIDQGSRNITLRPEGTASIARSFISNKLYQSNQTQRLWYLGPMFRYERPQAGRQRQFHQLGIECIGSPNPMADAEVIRLAHNILKALNCHTYKLELNCIGDLEERNNYKAKLIEYLLPYKQDLDNDSQKRLTINPLRILDSKDQKTQTILMNAPRLTESLTTASIEHFNLVCEYLKNLNIPFNINDQLVRGLDYYNHTAFEIKTDLLGSQDTICGGGRYDKLIKQLGGTDTPAVGWAIGIERLMLIVKNTLPINQQKPLIYLATHGMEAQKKIWEIILILEKEQLTFELDLNNSSLQKQLKRANKSGAILCLILGNNEIEKQTITLKWLYQGLQETIQVANLSKELKKIHILNHNLTIHSN